MTITPLSKPRRSFLTLSLRPVTYTSHFLAVILCVCSWMSVPAAASEVAGGIGRFGEITTWLILKTPEAIWRLEVDPFASMGGEAKYAAMSDAKWLPYCGKALEIPGANPGETIRIGDGVWEATAMVPPDMPGIYNEYPRLVVPNGYRFAYCQLDSPKDSHANLLMGLSGNKCKLYFNGKDLGTFDGAFGWEAARELPVELKQGVNHLVVRFTNGANFACRLVGENAEPLRDVKLRIAGPSPLSLRVVESPPLPDNQKLMLRAKEIPPLAPSEHPEFLGAKLARTMSLLESGRFTHRPVRIVFDGQSIESEWTTLLIQHLREKYPETTIISENRAIGGWFVWRMQKLLKHDVLPWQPDLVLFSAYQGTAEVWERFLSEIRSETTADIIIRTHHIGGNFTPEEPRENAETIMTRRLAQQYDVELVEVSNEWRDYLDANKMGPKELLRDGIHLNAKGETLMGLLYARHFKYSAASPQGWANTVRRFDVGRFIEDNKTDEIVLEGAGWTRTDRGYAQSVSPKDMLKLKFNGTRVDLILPLRHAGTAILIDGKKPSEWNLFHGTRPQSRTLEKLEIDPKPNLPMTYHTGKAMQEETWVLAVTHGNVDADKNKANQRVRFKLTGSKTGFDGEGHNDKKFVSNSGRITILPTDWETAVNPVGEKDPQPDMQPFAKPAQMVWYIFPNGLDAIAASNGWTKDTDYYSGMPYDYVTVADGLPCGVHELSLSPLLDEKRPDLPFVITGIEIHRPPMARDTSETTKP